MELDRYIPRRSPAHRADARLKLLLVVAMVLGIVMFSAMSYQTLSTGIRPFHAMKRYIHPAVAWSWAIGALIATVIWHLPQYALAAGMTDEESAAVLTYVRNSFGNKASVISAEQVKKVRAEVEALIGQSLETTGPAEPEAKDLTNED